MLFVLRPRKALPVVFVSSQTVESDLKVKSHCRFNSFTSVFCLLSSTLFIFCFWRKHCHPDRVLYISGCVLLHFVMWAAWVCSSHSPYLFLQDREVLAYWNCFLSHLSIWASTTVKTCFFESCTQLDCFLLYSIPSPISPSI